MDFVLFCCGIFQLDLEHKQVLHVPMQMLMSKQEKRQQRRGKKQ